MQTQTLYGLKHPLTLSLISFNWTHLKHNCLIMYYISPEEFLGVLPDYLYRIYYVTNEPIAIQKDDSGSTVFLFIHIRPTTKDYYLWRLIYQLFS